MGEVYEDAKFVPYSLLSKDVPSVYVSGSTTKNGGGAKVFQTLFIPEDITIYKVKGNVNYE